MATFNGKNDNLLFRCKACCLCNTIEIDLDNINDKEKLWNWLQQHSANGGDYVNVPINVEKTQLKERTEEQHLELVKLYGGVKQYLSSIQPAELIK